MKHPWPVKRLPASLLPRVFCLLLSISLVVGVWAVAGWGTAYAAPEAGSPTLTIVSASGYILTLEFDNWTIGTIITLGYSPADLVGPCHPPTTFQSPLPDTISQVTSNAFQGQFTWLSNLQGSYYLCASDPEEGTVASTISFQVTSAGTMQLLVMPAVGTTMTATASPTQTPTATPSPTSTTVGALATATPTPANAGASATNPGSFVLISIIVLCVLILALLWYLVYLWLRVRRRSTYPPQKASGSLKAGGSSNAKQNPTPAISANMWQSAPSVPKSPSASKNNRPPNQQNVGASPPQQPPYVAAQQSQAAFTTQPMRPTPPPPVAPVNALIRVFISYSRTDKALVDRLEQHLKAQQFDPWVDRRLQGGEAWLEAIQQAIDACQAMVVVLSPAAVQSRYVHMEYHYAQEEGKQVIPVLWRAVTIPMDLRLTHCLDFQSNYDEGLRQLVLALSRIKAPGSRP